MSVTMAKYVVMGEISVMTATLRRAVRYGHQNDNLEELLRNFSSLKDILSRQSDLSDLEPSVYFLPFLDVVRSEETNASTTAVALSAIAKFLQYDLIDHRLESAASTAEQVVFALKSISYVPEDTISEEIVILKFLHAIRSIVLLPNIGCLLSNNAICELIQSIIRIIFDPGFGLIVKKLAEQIWSEIVQLMFSRLPEFAGDSLPINDNSEIPFQQRGVAKIRELQIKGSDTSSGVDHRLHSKGHSKKNALQNSRIGRRVAGHGNRIREEVPFSIGEPKASTDAYCNDDEVKLNTSLPQQPSNHSKLTAVTLGEDAQLFKEAEDSRNFGVSVSGHNSSFYKTSNLNKVEATPAIPGESELSSVQKEPSEISAVPAAELSENLGSITLSGTSVDDDVENGFGDSVEIVSCEDPLPEASASVSSQVVHLGGSISSLDEVAQVSVDERHLTGPAYQSFEDDDLKSRDKDFVSSRGVHFTPASSERVPYGLASVKELLKFIAIIMSPLDSYTDTEKKICLGLELMTIALEVGGRHIANFPSLVELVKNDVCKSLLALLKIERTGLLVSTMRVCFLLFECLRMHLKFQLETYLLKLMDLVTSEETTKISYEIKEVAIDNIVSLWRIPGFVTELFFNYDCNLYCSNIFEDLTKTLSRTAFPVTAIYSVHRLSLEALLAVIDSVETHCHFLMVSSKDCTNKDTPSQASTSTQIVADKFAIIESPSLQSVGDFPGEPAALMPAIVPSEHYGCSKTLEHAEDFSLKAAGSCILNHEQICIIRQKKKLLRQGTERFNEKPSAGIDFLMQHKILPEPFNVEKVAEFIRTNYQLDKNKIGDYISSRKNVEVLRAFARSFNFTNTRIDEALRMYLETFRLPGEAQPISLILEHFADHWHVSNDKPFASSDAAFTLAYGIIMLNVDQHNHNVKKQSVPMTQEDFIKNLKGVNGGADFDRQLLSDIYTAIKTEEIVMPAEQTGVVKDNYLWKVLLKRGASSEGRFLVCQTGLLDAEVFDIVWSPTLVALSYLLDKVVDDSLFTQKLMAGYRKCATIAAHYGRTEVFDHLIQALYKYTGISSAETSSAVIAALGGDQRAQLTAKMLFTLAHKHGDVMHEGWRNLIDCTLILYKSGLMPSSVTTTDDFVDPRGFVSIARSKAFLSPSEISGGSSASGAGGSSSSGGLFSSIVSYITSSESALQRENEARLRPVAETCVINLHPEFIFSESTFLRAAALEELVHVLISACPAPTSEQQALSSSHASISGSSNSLAGGADKYDEEAAIFALELLIKVVLKNKDRVMPIWKLVRNHLITIVTSVTPNHGKGHSPLYKKLLERAVVGILRLTLRLCRSGVDGEVGSQALQCVGLLLLLLESVSLHARVARQMVYATHELLRTSASCLAKQSDWQVIFALLAVAGAGLKPSSRYLLNNHKPGSRSAIMPLPAFEPDLLTLLDHVQKSQTIVLTSGASSYDSGVQSDSETGSLRKSLSTLSEPDRGYTSDSETNRDQRTTKHIIPPTPSGARGVPASRNLKSDITGSWIVLGQEDNSTSPQKKKSIISEYSISLSDCELTMHDPYAMTKAAECLTQLVRGPAGDINGIDARNIESCIRCLRVFVEASLDQKRNTSSRLVRGLKGTSKSSALNGRSRSPASESDSDGEMNSAPPEYPHIAVQLLDIMHSLHISCCQITQLAKTQEDATNYTLNQRQMDPIDIWAQCRCPLLQGMARLCCDSRKPVRSAALGYLQRALLVPAMQETLGGDQWEACFHQVLFPLLQALLERNTFTDPAVADEARVRVITLLCKVFLQHLGALLELPTFTALWLTVLDFMHRYIRAADDEACHAGGNIGEDLLRDAIPESLKNMLLVMDTAGVFRSATDGSPTELWSVTWDRVSLFLPSIYNELFQKSSLGSPSNTTPAASQTSNCSSSVPMSPASQGCSKDANLPVANAALNDESEANLPPVVSLEEALQTTPQRTSLAIGGILLQETPLAPGYYSGDRLTRNTSDAHSSYPCHLTNLAGSLPAKNIVFSGKSDLKEVNNSLIHYDSSEVSAASQNLKSHYQNDHKNANAVKTVYSQQYPPNEPDVLPPSDTLSAQSEFSGVTVLGNAANTFQHTHLFSQNNVAKVSPLKSLQSSPQHGDASSCREPYNSRVDNTFRSEVQGQQEPVSQFVQLQPQNFFVQPTQAHLYSQNQASLQQPLSYPLNDSASLNQMHFITMPNSIPPVSHGLPILETLPPNSLCMPPQSLDEPNVHQQRSNNRQHDHSEVTVTAATSHGVSMSASSVPSLTLPFPLSEHSGQLDRAAFHPVASQHCFHPNEQQASSQGLSTSGFSGLATTEGVP